MRIAQRPFRWAAWLMAFATLLVAALLIANSMSIYQSGIAPENLTDRETLIRPIYSRELVLARLGGMTWAFGLWTATLLGVVILGGTRSPEEQVLKYDAGMRLALLRSRVWNNEAMRRQQRLSRMLVIVCALLCAGCAAQSLAYLLNPEHFVSRELEQVMGEMLRCVGPWVLGGLIALILTAMLLERSRRMELEAAKTATRRAEPVNKTFRKNNRVLVSVQIMIFAAAIVLMALGIFNGGLRDVLYKAINICTECIGLG